MDKFRIGVIGDYRKAKALVEDMFGANMIEQGRWGIGNIEFIHRGVHEAVLGWKWNGVIFADECEGLRREHFFEIIKRIDWIAS